MKLLFKKLFNDRGVSLIEVMIGLTLLSLAVMASFNYLSGGLGNIMKQGNRRAALERARQRVEQLMAADISVVQPANANKQWLTCAGAPCAWTPSGGQTFETNVSVNTGLANQQMETAVQWIDDPSAGTGAAVPDVLVFEVKVWFTSRFTQDDDNNRVYIRMLRTP